MALGLINESPNPRAHVLGGLSMRRATRRGFTLVELVLVMGIVAVVAVVAVPRFGHGAPVRRLDAGEKRILTDLAYARELARARSQSITVTFDNTNENYSVSNAVDPIRRDPAGYTVQLDESPYMLELGTVDLDGDNALIFDGFGTADSGGTIEISSGGRFRTVTIDAP